MEHTYCIYKHTGPTGKSYIGITHNTNQRWKASLYKSEDFRIDILKFGWAAFTHEILISRLTLREAEQAERFLIEDQNTVVPNGYNEMVGDRPTAAGREKIRQGLANSLKNQLRFKQPRGPYKKQTECR
jgi:hypothetical protein